MWNEEDEKEFWEEFENEKIKTSISIELWDEAERFIKTYLKNDLVLFKEIWANQSGTISLEIKLKNDIKTHSTMFFRFRFNHNISWYYWKSYDEKVSAYGELHENQEIIQLIEKYGK